MYMIQFCMFNAYGLIARLYLSLVVMMKRIHYSSWNLEFASQWPAAHAGATGFLYDVFEEKKKINHVLDHPSQLVAANQCNNQDYYL